MMKHAFAVLATVAALGALVSAQTTTTVVPISTFSVVTATETTVTTLAATITVTPVAVVVVPPPPPPLGATFYVSLTGNDAVTCAAAKTIATPRRTIGGGVACLSAGETLLIRGGTYAGRGDVIDSQTSTVRSGASWAKPITIGGYPGEVVIIKPLDGLHAVRLTTGAPSYLIFQDFIVDMGSTSGAFDSVGIYLSDGAHHNRFQRLDVKNAKSFGIAFSRNNGNSPFNEVLNSKIHNTGNGGGDNRNGHGLYVSTSDNLFSGNDVYDNEGFGLHLYDDDGPQYVNRNRISKNTIRNNGKGNGRVAYGIVLAHGADNVIDGNTITGNKGGVLVYRGAGNAAITNNVITANAPLEGVSLQYYASAPTVRGNTIFGNAEGVVDYGGTGAPIITGNVLAKP